MKKLEIKNVFNDLTLGRLANWLTAFVSALLLIVNVRSVSMKKPQIDLDKYKLVFSDEFDGDALNTNLWRVHNAAGVRKGGYWTLDQASVENGSLVIRTQYKEDGEFGSGWYTSGLETRGRFEHTYGYYECRCQLQKMPGWWSAFWMQSATQGVTADPGRSGIETDIMESFDPGVVCTHCFHYNGTGDDHRRFDSYRCGKDTNRIHAVEMLLGSDAFHTYGMLWEPDGYTVFIDGRQSGFKVGTGPGEAVSHVPQFILITTEAMWYRREHATGKPVPELAEAVRANDAFAVDFVRVFDVVE